MKLIVGLGNPGQNYLHTRHNIGFDTIDKFCELYNLKLLPSLKFKSLINIIFFNGEKIIIAKPQTFINLSGVAIKSIIMYYNIIPENVIVVYDDLDIAVGKIKIKNNGSSAGHNGIKNIIQELNSQNFIRIRIGIGKNKTNDEVNNYVLAKFPNDEKILIDKAMQKSCEAIKVILEQNVFFAMNKFNTKNNIWEIKSVGTKQRFYIYINILFK